MLYLDNKIYFDGAHEQPLICKAFGAVFGCTIVEKKYIPEDIIKNIFIFEQHFEKNKKRRIKSINKIKNELFEHHKGKVHNLVLFHPKRKIIGNLRENLKRNKKFGTPYLTLK